MKIKSLYSKLFQKISKKAKAETTTEKQNNAPKKHDQHFEIQKYAEGHKMAKKA